MKKISWKRGGGPGSTIKVVRVSRDELVIV